jgi:transposase
MYTDWMNETRTKQARDWRETRRLQAWKLKQKGWKQKDIAEALDVSNGAVSQWLKRAREGGLEALNNQAGKGAKPRLQEEQLSRLPDLLAKGAAHFGFRGDVWTRGRVAAVIKREFGVSYTPTHVGRILKKLNWSRQKPIERASQRDEEAIERWRTATWVAIEKKPGERTER